jgi:hypothetical protein
LAQTVTTLPVTVTQDAQAAPYPVFLDENVIVPFTATVTSPSLPDYGSSFTCGPGLVWSYTVKYKQLDSDPTWLDPPDDAIFAIAILDRVDATNYPIVTSRVKAQGYFLTPGWWQITVRASGITRAGSAPDLIFADNLGNQWVGAGTKDAKVPAVDVTFDPNPLYLFDGSTAPLGEKVTPADAPGISFESTTPATAKVDDKNPRKVMGQTPGEAEIQMKRGQDVYKKTKLKVVVIGVTFAPDPVYVAETKTAPLKATVTPASAKDKVTFDTEDKTKAEIVDPGKAPDLKVKGNKGGEETKVRALLGKEIYTKKMAIVKVFTVDELIATMPSTKNAVDKTAGPANPEFKTTNTSTDFVPAAAADLMVVIKQSADVTIKLSGKGDLKGAIDAKALLLKTEQNPDDKTGVGVGKLTVSNPAGSPPASKMTPNVPGNFRLVFFYDENRDGKLDKGEELRVLRTAVVQITMQKDTGVMTTKKSFVAEGEVNPGSYRVSCDKPMEIKADFLLEGGGKDKKIGVFDAAAGVLLKLGNVGNCRGDTFEAHYLKKDKKDKSVPIMFEDPDGDGKPGFPNPMLDAVDTQPPFRGNSKDADQGDGAKGGRVVKVTSLDSPAFDWPLQHSVAKTDWASTQGANEFREWMVARSSTFPETYFALAKSEWSATCKGKRNKKGDWVDDGAKVEPAPGDHKLIAVHSPADTAGCQVRGLSFVNSVGVFPKK